MWEDDVEDRARRRVIWLTAIIAVALLAVGGWYWYASRPSSTARAPAAVAAVPQPAASAAPQISNPLPTAEGTALPPLNDSDPVVQDALASVFGKKPIEEFLVPQNIVRHIVVTVDNLPRHKVAVELRPVKPTPGVVPTATQGDITTLGEENFARYAPLVRTVQATDVKAVAALYQRLYPLFQQAYEDLGYPGKYFNDRLVEVIDNLLQTPEVPAPIPVVQPKVMYEYAASDLESRSAGQKLLIRMGPANERIIKAKLRELRAEIAKKN